LQDGKPLYRFRFDPGKSDLIYRVESSASLTGDWSRVLFDSRDAAAILPNWDGQSVWLLDEDAGPASAPAQFYRLRVQLTEP